MGWFLVVIGQWHGIFAVKYEALYTKNQWKMQFVSLPMIKDSKCSICSTYLNLKLSVYG